MEIISKDLKQTKKIGRLLAQEILAKPFFNKGVVIGLSGELGSGKTAFLQGFARGLGIKENILSPTFIVFKKYSLTFPWRFFYHFDCYRIQKPEEIKSLGFAEIIADPRNIIAIEWFERLGELLSSEIIRLDFEFIDEQTRRITIL